MSQHVKADCAGQVTTTVTVNFGNKVVDGEVLLAGNAAQAIPESIFHGNTSFMACDKYGVFTYGCWVSDHGRFRADFL